MTLKFAVVAPSPLNPKYPRPASRERTRVLSEALLNKPVYCVLLELAVRGDLSLHWDDLSLYVHPISLRVQYVHRFALPRQLYLRQSYLRK